MNTVIIAIVMGNYVLVVPRNDLIIFRIPVYLKPCNGRTCSRVTDGTANARINYRWWYALVFAGIFAPGANFQQTSVWQQHALFRSQSDQE